MLIIGLLGYCDYWYVSVSEELLDAGPIVIAVTINPIEVTKGD